MCLEAGINVEGINAVAVGQWEFQIFAKGAKTRETKSGSRGTLLRGTQRSMASLRVAPETTGADRLERIWHARELLRYDLRTCKDEATFNKVCEEFGKNIEKHINVCATMNRG